MRSVAHASATVLLSNILRVAAGLAVLGLVLELGELAMTMSREKSYESRKHGTKLKAFAHEARGLIKLHLDVDKLCPLKSHTPDGKSANPCGLCVGTHSFGEEVVDADGAERELIRLGHLKRTLSCGHAFHAICVDRVFLSGEKANVENGLLALQCPTCGEPVT